MTVEPPGSAPLEGADFVEQGRTAPAYRLFSLDGFPVLVEDRASGRAIGVQVWEVPDGLWGRIVEQEPPEMVPGGVTLEDGRGIATMLGPREWVEARGGLDVSDYGSWKAYLAARA